LSINVGRSPGNPFTFRTPPGHSAGTFSRRENDESEGKLQKDNGSCPRVELPFVHGTSMSMESKRDGASKFGEMKKYFAESSSRVDERFVVEKLVGH
jgi:hypothetical protein